MRGWFLVLVVLFAFPLCIYAIPQFSALTGNRCSSCHVNPSGGGVRNDLGWYAWHDVSVVPRSSSALSWLYPADESNRYFNGTTTIGMDLRVQNTRGTAEGSQRVTFPMQAALYAAFTPVKAVTLDGSFNIAALRVRPNTDQQVRYPGQRMGTYSALIQPDNSWPILRTGLIRPSFGMRYDDHTTAPYSYTNGTARNNYLPPDFAEYGAEVTYESAKWLTLQAGVFGTSALSQVQLSNGVSGAPFTSVISGNSPTISARAVVWPHFNGTDVTAWLGASLLNNGNFSIASAMGSVGWTDHLSLMVDLTAVSLTNTQSSRNIMTELMWQIYSPLFVYARYENYSTTYAGTAQTVTSQATVLGGQIFVLPYVELRPEYRIWDTALEGTTNRWNLQLHIFY